MWRQWHQLDHMQVICTSLQTNNHASTSSLKFCYGPDAPSAAQPTVSKHRRQQYSAKFTQYNNNHLQSLYRWTWVSKHLQLRTAGFYQGRITVPAGLEARKWLQTLALTYICNCNINLIVVQRPTIEDWGPKAGGFNQPPPTSKRIWGSAVSSLPPAESGPEPGALNDWFSSILRSLDVLFCKNFRRPQI